MTLKQTRQKESPALGASACHTTAGGGGGGVPWDRPGLGGLPSGMRSVVMGAWGVGTATQPSHKEPREQGCRTNQQFIWDK